MKIKISVNSTFINVKVCVISAGRPETAPRVLSQFPDAVWYVPECQTALYRNQLPPGVRVVGVSGQLPMKAIQLNRALCDALREQRQVMATVDDDIVRCLDASSRKEVNLMDVVNDIAMALLNSRFSLGGPYSGTNTHWAPGTIRSYGRVPGALMVHNLTTGHPLLFDNDIIGMEDLDYCIAHHVNRGGVLLHGRYCLENLWSTNPGGYQDYRTSQNIKSTVVKLANKWSVYGCVFKVDLSRKNRIAFRVPWKRIADKYKDLGPA